MGGMVKKKAPLNMFKIFGDDWCLTVNVNGVLILKYIN